MNRTLKKSLLLGVPVALAVLLFVVLRGWLAGPNLYGRESLELGVHDYAGPAQPACPSGPRPGATGIASNERTPKGFRYVVKTPANYDANRLHPLIVVYAPAGMKAQRSERYLGLTRAATSAGFLVAYADSQPLSIPNIIELGEIPGRIAQKWCADKARIYFTGHSDGGTVSIALAFLKETRDIPAAIAPSAAGISGADLKSYTCPAPLPVMVMHNRNDTHFPGYGKEAAEWWAACNRCKPGAGQPDANSRLSYQGCAQGAPTFFWEREGTHLDWPGLNQEILEFFRQAGARK